MNFFLKAQIEFKETHSLTFQEIERNFKELKKENYGTYLYNISIFFLSVFNSLFFKFRSNSFLRNLIFFISKTQEVKEKSKF